MTNPKFFVSPRVAVGSHVCNYYSWQIDRIEQANAYNVHFAQAQVEVAEQKGENRN